MKTARKIALVVNQVRMEDEDELDVSFWLNRLPSERLAEVCRLRKNYFTWADKGFPARMQKVVHQRKL
ncbi:MAG: hypothetical protein EOO07_29955 [Chitinophagaceae bacterium]|nr:MAG: hypothetical protein EOO07_29955 [Chitinophagaceae bacterium]